MTGNRFVWLDNDQAKAIDVGDLPHHLGGPADYPSRSWSRWVRDRFGYLKAGKDCLPASHPAANAYFMEFKWADYLQQNMSDAALPIRVSFAALAIPQPVAQNAAMSALLHFRRRHRKARSLWHRLGRILAVAAIAAIVISVIPVVSLRWIDPPTSSFMLQRKLGGLLDGEPVARIDHQWAPWKRVSAAVPLAVVAAEDQRFPMHWGFDLKEIQNALAERGATGRLRGASTISQQVAKNLFLWSGRNWLRKGLEVYFTVLIEISWSKRRILEVYLNIAQFGDSTFGVGAASRRFFHKPASALTSREAALLAAVLPNPMRMRVDKPSPYVQKRAAAIQQQARQLGADFLNDL